jgi:hypothetical protein
MRGAIMKEQHVRISWLKTGWYGAEAGIALTLLYALAFLLYAVVRSTAAITATSGIDGGLVRTLIATWLSLAVSTFGFAVVLAVPAAIIGALTALALRVAIVPRPSVGAYAQSAVVAGLAISLSVSLVLGALVVYGLGVRWAPASAETLIFWLILPLAIYIIASAVVGWRVRRLAAV